MRKYKLINISVASILLYTIIMFVLLTNAVDELQEKVKYMDSKRIEYENKVDDLEQDYKLYEISLSNLKKNAKAQFCGGK